MKPAHPSSWIQLLIVFCLLGSGCLDTTERTLTPEPTRDLPCQVGTSPAAECVTVFPAVQDQAAEPHVATHPTEPGVVALTWTDRGSSDSDTEVPQRVVHVAVTRDGGQSWTRSTLASPLASKATAWSHESLVAVGPTGTIYVLFSQLEAVDAPGFPVLARSSDGTTWTYHRFADFPRWTFVPEYMDLAAAPDAQSVFVVVQNTCNFAYCEEPAALAFYRSTDGGVTFERHDFPGVSQLPRRVPSSPRVEAGHGGLVVIGLKTQYPQYSAWISVSQDGGRSFAAPKLVHQAPFNNIMDLTDPIAMWRGADGSPRIDLLYRNRNELVHYRSSDVGQTWDKMAPLPPIPSGLNLSWTVPANGPDGSFYALAQAGVANPPTFQILLHVRGPEGDTSHHVLATSDRNGDRRLREDYGGLSVGADGILWAAWGVPGPKPGADVQLARLSPAPLSR